METEEKVGVALGAQVDDFVRAFQRATSELKAFEAEANKVNTGLRDTKKAADDTGEAVQRSAEKQTAAFRSVATAAAIGFASITAAAGLAAKSFADFDKTIRTIGAVAGASAEELNQIRDAAVRIGIDTKFSTQQAADAFLNLGRAGLTTQQSMEAIPGVIALAASAGLDLGYAAEVAAGTVRGFGLAMSDTTRVADVLAKSANLSAIDVSDLAQSFKFVAPVAQASGQSLEAMSAALAILGNNMIRGEQAGTVLRASLLRLQAPSDEAAKTLKAIGLNVADATGRMKPFGQLLQELSDTTSRFNAVGQQEIFKNIFGLEAVSGISALVNTIRQTPGAFAEMEAAMNKAGGSAKAMQDQIQQGLSASLELMSGSAATAAQTLGEQLAPSLQVVVDGVTAMLNAFISASPAVKGFVAALAEIGILTTGSILLIAGAAKGIALFKDAALVAAAATPTLTAAIKVLGAELLVLVNGPVGVAIAALGSLALIYASVTSALDEANEAERRAQIAASESASAITKLTLTQRDQLAQTKALSVELETLARKTDRTSAENARMAQITDILKRLNPQYKDTVDAVARGHASATEIINRKADAYDRVRAAALAAAQAELGAARLRRAEAGAALDALQNTSENAFFPGVRDRAAAKIPDAAAEFTRQDAAVKAAEAELAAMSKAGTSVTVTPTPSVGGGSGGGASFSLGDGKGRGGGSAANAAKAAAKEMADFQKALRDNDVAAAERAAKAAIDDLKGMLDAGKISYAEFYELKKSFDDDAHRVVVANLSKEVDAAKAGTTERARAEGRLAAENDKYTAQRAADERELEKVRADANKRLDDMIKGTSALSLDEAAKVIEDAERRGADRVKIEAVAEKALTDNAVEGNKVRARLRKEEADRERGAIEREKQERVESLQAFQGAAGAAAQALGTLSQAFDRVGNRDAAAFASSMQRVAQDVQNLASGPMGAVTVAVARLTEAMANLGDKSQGTFQQWSNFFRDLNPVGKFNEQLGSAISRAFGGPSVEEAQAKQSAPELFERRFAEANKRLAEIEKMPERLRAGEVRKAFQEQISAIDAFLRSGAGSDAQNSGLANLADFIKGQLDEIPEDAAKAARDAAAKVADEIEKAKKRLDDLLTQQARAVLDFDSGAQDDAGNRISIERRALLDIDKLDADYAAAKARRTKALADLRKQAADQEESDRRRILDLEEQISQSRQDEEKRVRAILDEGIAVRQKSVEQDKRDRIQEVRDEGTKNRTKAAEQITAIRREADERRAQFDERIAQLNAEAQREESAHANAVARIRNNLAEQTNAHNAKMAQLQAQINAEASITGQLQSQVNLLAQQATLRERALRGLDSTAVGSSSTYTSGGVTTAGAPAGQAGSYVAGAPAGQAGSYTQDALIWAANNGIRLFADGGIVMRPTAGIVGEAGPEAVIPLAQLGQVVRQMNFSSGGGSGDVHIHVGSFTGTQDNIRQLANEVRRIWSSEQRDRGNYSN